VHVVDYSLETIALKWIQPRESAVQFDPGGEDDSQFIINDFVLKNCSYLSTDGLSSLLSSDMHGTRYYLARLNFAFDYSD